MLTRVPNYAADVPFKTSVNAASNVLERQIRAQLITLVLSDLMPIKCWEQLHLLVLEGGDDPFNII